MEIQPEEQPEQPDNSVFSINTWFNNLPIRIIGSSDEPFFYASDIAAILGIKQLSSSIKNFDQTELVSPDTRARCNLITYRKYKGDMRRDDSITLLTECGVYRIIFNSRSNLSRDFRAHIYTTLRVARQNEKTPLNIINQEDLQIINEKLNNLESLVKKYQKYNPVIYVFRIAVNGNPFDYILREDRDPDITQYDSCKRLYKFTTKPIASDYTTYNLYAEIYGNNGNVMDSLSEYSLELKPKSLKYCRYIPDCDFDDYDFCDFSECKIVYA